MLSKSEMTLDALTTLMPNMKKEISQIQNVALDSISRHSRILDESFDGPFTPSTPSNYGGENGEVFSAIYGPETLVPSFLHVTSDMKDQGKDQGLFNTNLRAFTSQATPLFVADNAIDQVNYLKHWEWNVYHDGKPPAGSGTLRAHQAFRNICAARKGDDGVVETFLMSGLDSRCDPESEGGRSYIYAWKYRKEGPDGKAQTYTGTGGTAYRIHGRSIVLDNHGQMQEGTSVRSHTVATLEGPIASTAGSAMRTEMDYHIPSDWQNTLEEHIDVDEDPDYEWEII
jgi:hypothetical protein